MVASFSTVGHTQVEGAQLQQYRPERGDIEEVPGGGAPKWQLLPLHRSRVRQNQQGQQHPPYWQFVGYCPVGLELRGTIVTRVWCPPRRLLRYLRSPRLLKGGEGQVIRRLVQIMTSGVIPHELPLVSACWWRRVRRKVYGLRAHEISVTLSVP